MKSARLVTMLTPFVSCGTHFASVRQHNVVDQFHDELSSRVGQVGFDWSTLIDDLDGATQCPLVSDTSRSSGLSTCSIHHRGSVGLLGHMKFRL